MSGSGGGGGYDYQADAFASVASYALAKQPLGWFSDLSDIPVAISLETGGAGDDLKIELRQGHPVIEVQVKHGASKDKHFTSAMLRLAQGLANDPALYAVLLVDGSTSNTIREELRSDIIRLGQDRRDDLYPITSDVINLLETNGIAASADLFRRLRIIVKDLQEGADGRAAALSLLTRVVKSPQDTLTAWGVLGKEGNRLIASRGRRDVHSLITLLGSHVALSSESENHVVVLERFRKWVLETNKEFFVTGLNITLPIKESWNSLLPQGTTTSASDEDGTLARQIHRYHEWERLAEPRNRGSAVQGEDALQRHRHLVIMGGPGAGKSTLGRRLAAWAAQQGTTVLKVSLRQVGRLIVNGVTFEDALLQVALGGSGIAENEGRVALSSPSFLLADGLDECDPNRVILANSLAAWSNGHPHCHVCVMTRPVGHAPSMLPGFHHLDLLPLSETAISDYSRKLIEVTVGDVTRARELWQEFRRQVIDEREKRRFASIAARNPLLLSFLVRLFLDGKTLTGNRAVLFEQIVDLIRRSPMNDRPATVEAEGATANRVAEVLGWLLIESPDRTLANTINALTDDLIQQAGLPSLMARQQAERNLQFWEERRLIERLTWGHIEALTFVHLNLGEYLAGRYIGTMKDEELRAWLARTRRDARWRQPILFACGAGAVNRIVPCLLELDDPSDPSSTEALLAASGISESESVNEQFVREVVTRLQQRLTSNIPLVTIEAGIGLCEIAPLAPEIVGAVAANLISHEQEWTRLAAVAACLAAGTKHISVEQTKDWLDNFHMVTTWHTKDTPAERRMSNMPQETYELQQITLPLAIDKVLSETSREEAEAYLIPLFEHISVSVGMLEKVGQVLIRHNATAVAEGVFGKLTGSVNWQDLFRNYRVKTDYYAAFLDAVITVTEAKSQAGAQSNSISKFTNLSALLIGMGFWQCQIDNIYVLAEREEEPALREVMRGAISALDLDMAALCNEAKAAMDLLQPSSDSEFFKIVRNVPANPDWSRALAANLDPVKVARGLLHPSLPVRFTAAQLLSIGVGGDEARSLVRQALHEGEEPTLRVVALLASEIWETDEAAGIILERLDSTPVSGFDYLYKSLATLYSEADAMTQERIEDALLKGILSSDPASASGAAEALEALQLAADDLLTQKLRAALEHWTTRGSWCDRCDRAVHDSSCSNCNRIPPNPRAVLIKELARMSAMGADELLRLCEDKWHDVRDTAVESLAGLAANNAELLRELLVRIKDGLPGFDSSTAMNVLNALLALPAEVLRHAISELLALADSTIPAVRARLVSSFTGAWIDPDVALTQVQRALVDPNPAVRNAATRTLRLLRTVES
jgi:hypothetical protein